MHAQIQVESSRIEAAERAENDRICQYDPPFNIRGGHGRTALLCGGRRCEGARAEHLRLEAARHHRLLRQPRRRSAPPLDEWDAICAGDLRRGRGTMNEPELTEQYEPT